MAQFQLGQEKDAERNLYYIWPESAYFHIREYHLGRLALKRKNYSNAVEHLRKSTTADGYDLLAKLALAIALAETGDRKGALEQLNAVEALDPTNRHVPAERWLLTGDEKPKRELLRLTGGQTQEAINVSLAYRHLERWKEAAQILQLVGDNDKDLWGTTPEFYYTLAYCDRRAGKTQEAEKALSSAQQAKGNVDRFPYREESAAVFEEAVDLNSNDATARINLANLLYYRNQPQEAIRQWEAASAFSPGNFSLKRSLGLAYAEQGYPIEKAAAELQEAVALKPEHVKTVYDLGNLYARAGRFSDQLNVLKKALDRSPNDDDLFEGILTAELNEGNYSDVEMLILRHTFATRHRRYELRDKYRILRYGEGAQAFHQGNYQKALALFQAALRPPPSLGIDTFAGQNSPRIEYYIGRTLEALGQQAEARKAYEKSVQDIEQLSGDRDSWNSENFFIVPSLDRLGRAEEAGRLEIKFQHFAETEMDDRQGTHRSEARYLLALMDEHRGGGKSADLLKQSLEARPDLASARLELRGDTIAPGSQSKQ